MTPKTLVDLIDRFNKACRDPKNTSKATFDSIRNNDPEKTAYKIVADHCVITISKRPCILQGEIVYNILCQSAFMGAYGSIIGKEDFEEMERNFKGTHAQSV